MDPVSKVVKDQKENAYAPLRNPYYSMQVVCTIVRNLKSKLDKQFDKTTPLHPYIIAIAIKFGPDSEILKKVVDSSDPYDRSSASSFKILTNFQSWAWKLNMPQKDILFLDIYQKVYDETIMNNLNSQS